DVAAAATALGIPEALVERSAEARATASGVSVDALLTEWAGGEAAPVTTAPAPEPAATTGEPPAPETEPDTTKGPEETTPVPEIVIEAPEPAAMPEPVPSGPYVPPVLVGAKDSPMTILAGIVGLFAIIVLVGLVGPSIPTATAGARSSDIPYTATALEGQEIYLNTGCASCHTQMVRPVIADVGLGAVTLGDTNQVLGARRFGPDLSDVGSRMTATQIEATIEGFGDHPRHLLDPDDLTALVAYLGESTTSAEEEGES
ncbi:MAG: cbb3-type cytochrome c oxidase subunit II, partial [Acidimicrobiia bacterium]